MTQESGGFSFYSSRSLKVQGEMDKMLSMDTRGNRLLQQTVSDVGGGGRKKKKHQVGDGLWWIYHHATTLWHNFRMETKVPSVASIRIGDTMFSIDLKDAYFQIPVHPELRPYPQFMSGKRKQQFKALYFGLLTTSQVFEKVFAQVLTCAYQRGIRFYWYLEVWLVVADSLHHCHPQFC